MFKIPGTKIAKSHIFYKAVVAAAKKWSIFLKYSSTDSFIKLYDIIILNIISLLSLIFFVQNEHKKRTNRRND